MSQIQRLDKWLWQARFYKTRGLAQRMCAAGKIRINSQRVRKAHYALKSGDILTFPPGLPHPCSAHSRYAGATRPGH